MSGLAPVHGPVTRVYSRRASGWRGALGRGVLGEERCWEGTELAKPPPLTATKGQICNPAQGDFVSIGAAALTL